MEKIVPNKISNSWILIFFLVLLLTQIIGYFFISSNEAIFLTFCTLCSFVFLIYLIFVKENYFYHPFFFIFFTVFIGVTLRGFVMVFNTDDPRINDLFLLNENISFFIAYLYAFHRVFKLCFWIFIKNT